MAALTYNMKRKSFVKMYTENSLSDGVFLKNLYEIWKQYEIEDCDVKIASLINKKFDHACDIQTLRDNQRK